MPSIRNIETSTSDRYTSWVGLIFLFNLIVGTGALTLPSAFAKTGWLLGLIFIIVLAFISYLTVTFVVETMACANAIKYWTHLEQMKRERERDGGYLQEFDSTTEDDIDSINAERTLMQCDDMNMIDEQVALFSERTLYYEIETKVELVDMARLFFNDIGLVLFFLCFTIYLYGDLAIYSSAVATTLRDVICTRSSAYANVTDAELDSKPCWTTQTPNDSPNESATFTRFDCYRLSLIGFAFCICPFVFFKSISKTKFLQMGSILMRWCAFLIMIIIALRRILFINDPEIHPSIVNPYGIPAIFGAGVYSFMCHHSIPGLIAPIRDKSRLFTKLSADYLLIGSFYLFLAMTGSFAFAHLEDLYTLNFIPSNKQSDLKLEIIEYFLALFPIFCISSSYPILAITLRNNLEILFMGSNVQSNPNSEYSSQFLLQRCTFGLCAVLPPLAITYFTDNLLSLVSFTGIFAGAGIQYIIPVTLLYFSRKKCATILGPGIVNDYRSPFQSVFWLIFVLIWSCTSVMFVSVNFLSNSLQNHTSHLATGFRISDLFHK